MTTISNISATARARRREMGLTQADLAERLGMSRRWVAQFERGGGGGASLEDVLRLLAEVGLDLELTRRAAPGGAAPAGAVDLDAIIEEHRG